jgi:hypothetical protein
MRVQLTLKQLSVHSVEDKKQAEQVEVSSPINPLGFC